MNGRIETITKKFLDFSNTLSLCCCMLKFSITLFILLFSPSLKAQWHINPDTIKIKDYTKTQVKLLASDSLCSTFLIVIPGEVKSHFHSFHTENVIVVEGKGIMKLGIKEFKIKKGDVIVIPKGIIHSVRSKGRKPLRVISIQSPYFDGKDRVMVKD